LERVINNFVVYLSQADQYYSPDKKLDFLWDEYKKNSLYSYFKILHKTQTTT